jgi:hypothetical protein
MVCLHFSPCPNYFFLNTSIHGNARDFENNVAPSLEPKFPSAFIETFLEMKVEDNDINDNLIQGKSEFKIKDLIYLNTDTSLEVVNLYRNKYIEEIESAKNRENLGTDVFENFKDFSGYQFEVSNLLEIERNLDEIPSLEDIKNSDNYFYAIKTKDDKFTLVYFKKMNFNEISNRGDI